MKAVAILFSVLLLTACLPQPKAEEAAADPPAKVAEKKARDHTDILMTRLAKMEAGIEDAKASAVEATDEARQARQEARNFGMTYSGHTHEVEASLAIEPQLEPRGGSRAATWAWIAILLAVAGAIAWRHRGSFR